MFDGISTDWRRDDVLALLVIELPCVPIHCANFYWFSRDSSRAWLCAHVTNTMQQQGSHSGEKNPARSSQRRHLTVLFSDLSDSTALAESVDSERFQAFLEQIFQCFERIIPLHGGIISQIQGDGVFAMFGFDSREDEGRRATEAALDLHEAVKNLTLDTHYPGFAYPTMHSGIHSGLVLAVEGDQLLGRYVLVGAAANLASRLADEADADEILVSADTLGADAHFFELKNRRSLKLKGQTEGLTTFSVVGRSQVNTRFEARQHRGLARITGRDPQLNELSAQLELTRVTRSLHVQVIWGEGGIGKTRLVEDFLKLIPASGSDIGILKGYCESYLHSEPLQPILQIWRQAFELQLNFPGGLRDSVIAVQLEEAARRISPSLSEYLPIFQTLLVPSTSNVSITEYAAIEATVVLLRALAHSKEGSARTLVLFIDDWQWADDATRRIYQALPQLADLPIFVLFASREAIPEADQRRQSARQLELHGLSNSQAYRMIRSVLPEVDSRVAVHIEQASGGNPLFLEELCHSIERGTANRWYEDSAEQIPNVLNALIEARVANLAPRHKELVRAAAVIGNVCPIWLITFLTGVRPKDEDFLKLAELDVLFPGDTAQTLKFKHGITRHVVLNSIGLDERMSMHRSVANAIEQHYKAEKRDELLELLAYHHREGGNYPQAAHYAALAGDKSLQAGAVDRGRQHYQVALQSLDRLEWDEKTYRNWMTVAQQLAFSSLYDTRRDSIPTYERAIALANEHGGAEDIIDAEYWLGIVQYALGNAPAAIEHSERFLSLLPQLEDNPGKVVQCIASGGFMAAAACQYEKAARAMDSALDAQRPYKSNPRLSYAFAYSLCTRAMVHGDIGEFEQAYACFDEAEALLHGSTHQTQSSVTSMRSAVSLWFGDWSQALDYADRTIEYAERMGSRYVVAIANAQRAFARYHLGHEDAVDDLARTLDWFDAYDQALWTSLHYSWICEVMVREGRFEAARKSADRVFQRVKNLERLGESVTCCALAMLPAQYRNEEPTALFARARESATVRHSRREHALIDLREAEWFYQIGSIGLARERLEECQPIFKDLQMGWHIDESRRLYVRCSVKK